MKKRRGMLRFTYEILESLINVPGVEVLGIETNEQDRLGRTFRIRITGKGSAELKVPEVEEGELIPMIDVAELREK